MSQHTNFSLISELICKNICLILGPHIYSDILSLNLECLHCKYSNILKYLNIHRQIYFFNKYLLDFEATNIFRYSLDKEKLHSLHAPKIISRKIIIVLLCKVTRDRDC